MSKQYFWEQCYEIGNQVHWALCDSESKRGGLITDHLLVLFNSSPEIIDGRPLSEQPMPKLIVDLLNKHEYGIDNEILDALKKAETRLMVFDAMARSGEHGNIPEQYDLLPGIKAIIQKAEGR